ncbi:MAG: hypothetical protein HOV76_31520 [Hamadaea sp.]|nr:hypothetical protein [Hamadaea sp.]
MLDYRISNVLCVSIVRPCPIGVTSTPGRTRRSGGFFAGGRRRMSVDVDRRAEENLQALVDGWRDGIDAPRVEYLKPVAEFVLSKHWQGERVLQLIDASFDKVNERFDKVDKSIRDVRDQIAVADKRLDRLETGQEALRTEMNHGFAAIDHRFRSLEIVNSATERRLELVEAGLETLNAKVDKRFEAVDKRFAAMDAKFDKRFAAMDAKFDKRFEESEVRILKGVADLLAKQ